MNGVQEAGGSNPLTQTKESPENAVFSGLFTVFGNFQKWQKMVKNVDLLLTLLLTKKRGN